MSELPLLPPLPAQPTLVLLSANPHTDPYPVYPLALSYLASAVRRRLPQVKVELLDIQLDDDAALQAALARLQPALIGVSLRNVDDVNSTRQQAFIDGYAQLMRKLRQWSSAELILGGAGFSIYPELLFARLKPDYAVVGEGEETLIALLEARLAGAPLSSVAGLCYRAQDGALRRNPPPARVRQPCLDFDGRLLEHYYPSSGMLNIQTKRGCPYQCIYCNYPQIDGRQVRTLAVEEIVDSVARLHRDHGADYLFFTDSVFNIKPGFNDELAEALVRAALPVRWGAYFSPRQLSHEQLALYQRAGLTHIEFGTESLSDAVLHHYRKPFDVAEVVAVSERCRKLGINYAHFLILGGWGETRATLSETLANCTRMHNTVYFPFFGMRVYPNTGLQQVLIEAGELAADDPLLAPRYYLAPEFDADWFKQQAATTGRRWVFPDEELAPISPKLRRRHRGPMWEWLAI